VLPDPARSLARGWHGSVHERFAWQAARVPDRPAVVEGDRTWTYAALQRASRRLGGHLRRHGIGSGDLVAIHGRRSASLVSALLGVLEAGAGFVILDPAYPAWRRAECVRLARP